MASLRRVKLVSLIYVPLGTSVRRFKLVDFIYVPVRTSQIGPRDLNETSLDVACRVGILAAKQEFFFAKVAHVKSITVIVLLGFSLILLHEMFISECLFHTTLSFIFFVNNFFSNVYISVNTIFECYYLSFD